MFGAEEALRVGFVNSVWGTKEEAVTEGLKMAGVIAGRVRLRCKGRKSC
jgi:delta(3,5)-delta(2,4)-dienoyl-CoA isomerase